MIVAVLADVHSNLHALKAVLDEISRLDVKKTACAGDIVGYGAFPNECCSTIKNIASDVVLGNHDVGALKGDHAGMNPFAARAIDWTSEKLDQDSRTYLGSLGRESQFSAGGKTFAMFHGSPTDIEEYVFEDKVTEELVASARADVLILGHTHVPCVVRTAGRLFINPGSVGQPRDGDHRASFALMDTDSGMCTIKRVTYDLDAASEAIKSAGLPRFLADRLHRGL